ncbi:glycosyltransferase family 4 protein [Candidatus Woesearchaeota archaeon]|nr:glycosyltransferase family 4 protein [Candidatus Woesearchaeota archaeon]
MKILMVCPDWFPNSAGLAQSCYDTCKQFIKHGHEVKVIVAKDKNVDHKDLNVKEIPYLTRFGGRNPFTFNIFDKIKEEVEWCDVVCLFSYMYIMNSQIAKLRCKGIINKPVIHFYRGSLESNFLKHVGLFTKLSKIMYDWLLAKPMFKCVNHVISNSEPTLALMEQKYDVSKDRLSYVKNALYVDEYPLWTKENKRIVFIGRLVDNKGIKFFGRILESIPSNWKFTIIGDGPLKKQILKLKDKYDNIELIGKVNHEECLKLISESDINILPTFAEGSPRSVMEASACGVPSICFAVGDVPNTIPSNCGYSITPYNIEEFCSKLELLIKDKDLRERMGISSRKFVEENMDWEVVYPQIEKILKEVVE